MVIASGLLFVIGYISAKMVTQAPLFLLGFATTFLYYHIAHFIFGFGSLIYYVSKIRKKLLSINVVRTIVGIVLTPISAIILYAAILLIALTNCST
ncbi:MAG: hypothetical protein RBR75_03720 [Acholeplasmataceae bacterium]|jgi:hypothetical protein|nr:hypothetical protein [Acholeplasmataceae bacterium]